MQYVVTESGHKRLFVFKSTLTISKRVLLALALSVFFVSNAAMAFIANISVSPNPSTGNYTVSWDNYANRTHTLEESKNFGSWSAVTTTTASSWSKTGQMPGTYRYRLTKQGRTCSGFPEPTCVPAILSSEGTSVTVTEPGPPTPTGLTGPATDYNGSYTISWNASSGATSYKLQQKLGSGSWSQIYSGSSTGKAISGNGAGTYSYQVRACNASSVCSDWSSTRVVTVQAAPSTPGGLTGPTTDYNGSYTISWNASTNSTSYRLEEKVGSGSWVQIYSGSSVSKAISGKTAGTYYYRVKGCNVESVCSAWSSTKTVTVQAAPSTPGGLSGPAMDYDGSYTVSWNSSTNSSSYQLQRKLGSGSWAQIYSASATSKAESSLAAGSYSYRVRGCNAESVCSGWSATHVTTVQAVPSTPSGLAGPATGVGGNFTISWNASTHSTSYQLHRQPNSGTWSQVYSGSATSKNETALAQGTYSYRVRGCNVESVCSGWSSTHVVMVPAAPTTWLTTDASDFPDAAVANPSVPGGDTGSNSVGALQGSGGVSGGQASYSIPIVVPPGRKDMQPSVSLNYSSSAGSGVAGVGWGVSGVSTISRCAATAAQDGFTAGVTYDASRDRLCLDGQRLVVVSGIYGASGAVYRTELDIFARITQIGSINSSTSYFTVDYKNGRTGRFGFNNNSRHKASGRTEVMTWSISDVQDPSGNTMTFAYIDHGNGEQNIDAIHYTGVNGSNGDRHVRFTYEARPNARTFYRAGGKTRSTQRLKTIKTEYQSTLIREYTLDYGTASLSTNRSLLRSVQECAYENGVMAHCLPPTTFEWQEAAPQYVMEQLQFEVNGTPTVVHGDKRWLHDILPQGDANGDGVKDWTDWYINAEGEKTGDHANSLATCYRPIGSFYLSCLQADFNADGLTDSFRQNNSKFEIKLAGSSTWVNTGIDWIDSASPGLADLPLGFADFNGDGWVDLAFVQAQSLWVYFHTRNLSSPYSASNRQLVHTFGSAFGGSSRSHEAQLLGDMDGNGTPDFVLSRYIDSSNQAKGLPEPETIILTKSLPGGSMAISTRAITGLLASQSVNAHFFHDVNGDGLPDLLGIDGTNASNVAYRLNNGNDFETNWTDLGFKLPMRTGRYFAGPSEWFIYRYPVMSKVFSMDYDGDGRDELMIADSVLASGCSLVNEVLPNGTIVPSWPCDDDLYKEYSASANTNVGAPINGDVKDNSVRRYLAKSFSEDASGNIVVTSFVSDIVASAAQTAVVDATGDGLPDVITAFGCRLPEPSGCLYNDQTAGLGGTVNATYQQEGAWINRNRGTATGAERFEGYDLMNAAEDGFGNRHEWTYKPLSSDAYDTPNSDFYQTTHSYQASNPDYFHFASSMNVVADHRVSNGVGGLNSTKYRYRGAIFNNKGRGFQGFKSIIAEQDVYASGHALAGTDKSTRTDFHQIWPLSSHIDKVCTWLATDAVSDDNPNCGSVLSKTTTNGIHNVATSGGARFVAVSDQTDETFDLITRANLITRQTQRSFDAAGNITSETATHTDDWTTNSTQTTRSYTLDWVSWWLDKIDSQVVTRNPVSARHVNSPTIAAGTDAVKTVTTGLTQYDTTHRLPTIVTVSASDSSLTHTTTTQYNARGLPSQISITGTGVTGPRTVTTTYSDNGATVSTDGYFPFTITNALGHQAEQHTDPKHGQPLSRWDANDLHTTTNYDAFGRASDTTPPGQPTTHQRYFWCGGATSCPSSAVFAVKTYRAGSPETHSFLDLFGREVQSSVQSFAGTSFINVSASFDARGNTTFTSTPYDLAAGESATIGTRYLSFDALGRLQSKEIDQASGAVFLTSYTYNGLKTSINAGGLLMHRIYNGLDQLVETRDAAGGYTRYAYDGAGNPIVLQDPALNSITASYNTLGHKAWVNDPNMGLKSFTYNSLGEVLTELDANGDTVGMTYDVLGRLSERRVNGTLTGSWHYDNGAADKGLGLLDYEDSHPGRDGSGLQKHYTYSLAATGRKDLTKVRHRFYTNSNPSNAADYDTDYYIDSYYARPKGVRYPGGVGVGFIYNNGGYVTQEKDASSNYIIRQVTARDSRNQVTASSLTNGLLSHTAEYYDASGQMKSIVVTGSGGDVHNLYYEYDTFGNLDYQRTQYGGAASTESFVYDDLHRLTQSSRTLPSGSSTINYAYNATGNLTLKDDYATSYSYSAVRPNAVASINKVGGGSVNFSYDANGNMTTGDGRALSYNAFNKPTSITAGGITANFHYGSDLSRYKQTKSNGETTLYIDKLMEIVTVGSTTDYRHYLGDVAILTKTGGLSDPYPEINYLHRDRLGSLATITDASGLDAQARGFDPFGRPRDGDWADRSPSTLASAITDRGFTEHEHLDESQLIHMNGRIYDYNLGRFLSVDPFIQSPGNSQSLNPYSYIMNNPLAGTDPSGYRSKVPEKEIKSSATKAQVEKRAVTGSRIITNGGQKVETSSGSNSGPRAASNNGASQNQSTGSGSGNSGSGAGLAVDETKSRPDSTGGSDGNDENTVILRKPWTMPEKIPEAIKPSITPEEYDELKRNWPYRNGKIDRELKAEIEDVLENQVLRDEMNRVLDASVENEAELGALRVYREADATYGVYSVGTPRTRSSMGLDSVDTDLGEHVIDIHPHPHSSSAKTDPSPRDLATSYGYGVPGVILYRGGFFGRKMKTKIYRGTCKKGREGDC